ncbi:hypothetical protein [Ralstonia wenshanensis]|uniref:hypothetical protein n=1 Tax=Ralstonia wenshanensis TaxID=2842456 RepID=UPI003D953040
MTPEREAQMREEQPYERKLREEREMRATLRGRHFLMCRGIQKFTDAVAEMPLGDAEKRELVNMANVLLRLAVVKNGGRISDQTVNAF